MADLLKKFIQFYKFEWVIYIEMYYFCFSFFLSSLSFYFFLVDPSLNSPLTISLPFSA